MDLPDITAICKQCHHPHARTVTLTVLDLYCCDECRDGHLVRISLGRDPNFEGNTRSVANIRRLFPLMALPELRDVVLHATNALHERTNK